MADEVLWEVVQATAKRASIENSRRMIFGAAAPGSATLPAANWIRFNSCSDTSPSRRPSSISVASRSCVTQSTTKWESSPERIPGKSGAGNPPLRDKTFFWGVERRVVDKVVVDRQVAACL
jgi:hypothetical protein